LFEYGDKDIERFVSKVQLASGPLETQCWLWEGAKSRGQGNTQWYGSFRIGDKVVRAHKFSFVAIGKGVLLPKQPLDHLCETSLCVCPKHLEAVTTEINQARKGRVFRFERH
jgi:hypothetical protein